MRSEMPHENAATALILAETKVARIGLGTNRLTKTREHIAFVREAVAAGVSHIDTAHSYTGDDSEETIGAALSQHADGAEGIVFVPFVPLRGDGGRSLAEIARRNGATPAQITLAWLLRRSPTMLPIPGTLSLDH
jgi:pyridoxine 4-dehydrogenase